MTLPTSYSWFPIGERLRVCYEAPQGRRVNAIGAYFSHGPLAGGFAHRSWASLPKSRAKKQRKTAQESAAAHGLCADEVGPIDAARFLTFVWQIAGRPDNAPAAWKRERPLCIVLDNYWVHKSQPIEEALPALEAADVYLLYLPSYSPELSGIEPIWNDIKRHQMPTRSHQQVAELKGAVDDALARKADQLRQGHTKSTNFLQRMT
jgi:hypothetical protein